MMRQRMISMMVVTLALSGISSELFGTTAQARPGRRSTVIVSRRPGVGRRIGPPRRRTVVTSPWRHRFHVLGYPCPRTVVVPAPAHRHVVVHPAPTVSVHVPTVRIQPTTLTIWVTNSNGSRISVQLVREGAWYVGPHGEYYANIPTNEQLRALYGF